MEKLSKERKEELYGSLLLINIYCLEPQKNMSLDDYRKVLEEIKLKILKIRDRETEENTKELFKQLKPLKKLSLFYPEEECFISNKREVVNQFKDMISEDLFYLPYNFVKKNFKLPKVYSISHSSKYGIFEAISSIITPETEFMEDALISYLILKNEKELFKDAFKDINQKYNQYRMRNYYMRNAIFSCCTFMEGILNNMLYDYYEQVEEGKVELRVDEEELNYCKTGYGDFDEKWGILVKIKPNFKKIESEKVFKDFKRIKVKRNLLIHYSPVNSKDKEINQFEKMLNITLGGIKGAIELSKLLMLEIEKKDCILYHNFDYKEYEKAAKKFLGLDE